MYSVGSGSQLPASENDHPHLSCEQYKTEYGGTTIPLSDLRRKKLQLYISLYLVSSVALEFGSDLIPLWILFNGQFGV
jgi:hypothetical protein